jgi:predicted ester cyclase
MILTVFPDLRIEVEQMLASGDFVIVRARLTGTQKGTYAGLRPLTRALPGARLQCR